MNRLSDRVNTLGTNLVQRMDGLDARVRDIEHGQPGEAPIGSTQLTDLNRKLDILGKTVPASVDQLGKTVDMLRLRFAEVAERIRLLESIQKTEASELRERYNALSKALSEIGAPTGR